ncbi:DJ-1/PfpI family protein [Haliangium ochraceum]|uniref:ThiJ/PfpI domain protein n=1 Tax=Haliangium ochraceum (strain DSM 14365 / JCM 11303 / SMP-2) TaxID=502025 RepID=D0LMG5_HALO1|nr:DJ-1/PfpI family protein [Haliangium ochraceum]ACY18652.1 ThiJ/PfpI domain protein [Haliangium ochraceum DSM 14365]
MKPKHVAILIFDDVEVLDFAGPYEVFSRTRLVGGVESRRTDEHAPFRVFTVARTSEPISAVGGLRVIPDHDFASAPNIDILVIPGGFGTRPLLDDTEIVTWIQEQAAQAQHTTSVCTGALLLAKAGLLRGRRATTHWGALDSLGKLDETITVEREQRVVDDALITSAGIAAGMDMAFHVVASLHGREVAEETAHYIEYPHVSFLPQV